MKNQKSRRLNRKQIKRKTIKRKTIKRKTIKRKTIKRKTIKRKQNKKLAYNQKKMYGGDFNLDQQNDLKGLLTTYFDFSDDEELEDVMKKLNIISQLYSSNPPYNFNSLIRTIENSNSKEDFIEWLKTESEKVNGVTDNEDSDNDYDDDVYYDDDDDDGFY